MHLKYTCAYILKRVKKTYISNIYTVFYYKHTIIIFNIIKIFFIHINYQLKLLLKVNEKNFADEAILLRVLALV